MNEKEIQCKAIDAILICVTKYFCMRIKACNLRKYRTQGSQETFVILHHNYCKGLLTQNM